MARIAKQLIAMGMAGVAMVGVAAGEASAATDSIRFDINSISVQSKIAGVNAPFLGVAHTGALALVADANSTLNGIAVDDVDVNPPVIPAQATGSINLVNGAVTGGTIT